MKRILTVLAISSLAAACGGNQPAAPSESAGSSEESTAPTEAQAQTAGDPCAPLENDLVLYDTAGTPFPFTIEYPEGFQASDLVTPGVTGVDFTYDLSGKGGTDYILRFGGSGKVVENAEGSIDVWPKIGVEKTEVPLPDGSTLYIGKKTMGELVGFQALLPGEGGMYMITAGVTDAPDECEDAAVERVFEMLKTVRPNPDRAPLPES